MRIKFFSNFCDSMTCKTHYERVCEVSELTNYGPNKALYITTEEDYTHAIILNTAMPVLKKNISKANVLGLAFEPPPFLKLTPEFIDYAQKYICQYFIGSISEGLQAGAAALPDLFKAHYAYIWHITPFPMNYVPVKTKRMSIMVSEKQFAPGHKYRHVLVKHILSTDLPIDIYGKGCALYKKRSGLDPRLKGNFAELEPYAHYDFHIGIENFMTPAYFSEKITNSLLCSTTPIYWGCKTILEYFPANVIVLTGDVEKDMALLRAILLEPAKYKARFNLLEIKNRLNLLKNVPTFF